MTEKNKKEKGGELTRLKVEVPQVTLNEDSVRRLLCRDATRTEIILFLNQCKMWGLNPLKREIYLIKYQAGEPAATVIGYETFLKRAERQKKLKGWMAWTEGEVKTSGFKACIKIKRSDWDEHFYHEVYWDEYARHRRTGELTRFWDQQPRTQLKKVVISQGFRLCFPDELSGLPYIVEEMPIDVEQVKDYQEAVVVEEEEKETEKNKIIDKITRELLEQTIDPKAFNQFLGEVFQPRKKEEGKEWQFVGNDNEGNWRFELGNLEHLRLCKLHIGWLIGQYIEWEREKAQESESPL